MLRTLAALVVGVTATLVAAAPAFAGTANLSGTVTTTVPTNFADDSATTSANVTGASNSTFMTIRNTSPNVSGTWTVSAGLSMTGLVGSTVQLTFYVQTPNSSTVTAVLNRIQFRDTGGNTATLSAIGFGMSPGGNNTLTAFTITTTLSSYTTSGSFSAANVNSIVFDITLTNSGNNKRYLLDAVDVTSTPEPATLGLFAFGVAGLGCVVRRRARGRTRRARRPPRPPE